jgi:catechol 2,3-dioxygenase-like lactoylglutathione lyase family enzyme
MSSVSIRYMIDDVPAALRFYTTLLGFSVEHDASPAFASVVRDGVRLLLSGEGSSGKQPLADGRRPGQAAHKLSWMIHRATRSSYSSRAARARTRTPDDDLVHDAARDFDRSAVPGSFF